MAHRGLHNETLPENGMGATELTGQVSKRDMEAQLLDSMDIERERGITIKLTPVRIPRCGRIASRFY